MMSLHDGGPGPLAPPVSSDIAEADRAPHETEQETSYCRIYQAGMAGATPSRG